MNLPPPLRRLRSRLVAVAVSVTAVVFVLAALLIVDQQRDRLLDLVDDALRGRADELVAVAEAGRVTRLPVADLDDQAAQVTTLDGAVLAASANLDGAAAIASRPAEGEQVRTVDGLPIEDDEYRILSRRVELPDGGTVVVHVAENIDDVADGVLALRSTLLLSFPALLLVLGALTWWLVGAALAPVAENARRQERFVADASHELRRPLARARSRLEVEALHGDDAELRSSVVDSLGELSALESLLDELLELARAEDGRSPTEIDLDDVVLEEVAALRQQVSASIDASAVSGATVIGRRSELQRVVRNLVENACRYAASSVRLGLVERDRCAVLTVDDDGPGIPEGDRAAVFERFARLDPARTSGGSGLGLALVADIVGRGGGTIAVRDSPLGGARFEVELPAAR